jgi:hypothetical protein
MQELCLGFYIGPRLVLMVQSCQSVRDAIRAGSRKLGRCVALLLSYRCSFGF